MGSRTEWEEEEMRQKIIKEKRKDNVEAEKSNMDRKAEALLLERRMQMENLEKEMEKKLEGERSNLKAAYDKHEYEKRLAAEMSRLKREELEEQKTREHLRESSEELKLLESKLRAAYVNKQLIAQMAEKEALAYHEKLEKIRIQNMIEAEERCMKEQAQLKEQSLIAEKYKLREDMLNQINEGNKKVKDAERDLAIEKAMLAQSLKKMREEDDNEKEAQLQRLEQFKQEIKDFQMQKEIKKQNEKKAKEEEELRIKRYEEEKDKQQQQRTEFERERQKAKNSITDQMALVQNSNTRKLEEREDILAILAEEEIRQRDLKKDKEKADAALKLKEEFLNAYNKHMEEKKVAWIDDFEDQKRYRNQLLESIAEQEKQDMSSVGNKEKRSKKLRESLLNQMKDKHRRQVEAWQRETALEKLREVEERERLKVVQEERMKMLKSHAPNLVGYLPRGVLDCNDICGMGPEFMDKLKKHNKMNFS